MLTVTSLWIPFTVVAALVWRSEKDYPVVDWVARHSLKEVEGGFTWKFDPAIWQHFSIGDTAARLKETKCRIAVFRGEHSILLPPEIGEYMFNLLGRSAPVVEIPQAQHHIMLDQPLAFVAALRALLTDWNHSVSSGPANMFSTWTPPLRNSARNACAARCSATSEDEQAVSTVTAGPTSPKL